MRVRVSLVVCVLASLVADASAQSLSLNSVAAPTGITVTAGGPVTVDVSGGPGNTTDWIGLFPTGAPDYGSLTWSYLSGTTTAPPTGLTAVTFSRPAPVTAGTYEWRLYASDSNTRLVTSGTLTVTATTATLGVNGTAAPNPLTLVAGTNLVVTLANGPGNPGDWIALAPVGAPATTIADWRYLNNTTVAPTSGTTSATVTLVAPTTTGDYELRLFPATQATKLVSSGVVTVTASTAALTVNGTSPPTAVSVNAGTFVTVGASSGPANPGDWVGLYAVGAPDPGALVWQYLNGLTTLPTSGSAGASLTFSIPNVSGSYEFRFFSSGSYVRLATSTSLVVAGTQLSVNGVAAPGSTTAAPASQAIVSVGSGPGYLGDWVGLYAAGASDYEMLDWRYLNDTATMPSSGLTAATLHFAVPATLGTYEFRFFIDDTYGRLATSGAMVVAPAAPVVTVALTGPFPGTTFNGPASLVVAANATVSGGTIQRVDFYDGATLIGTSSSAPYSVSWSSPSAGAHVLTAVAVDDTNATTTSTAVGIVIGPAGSTAGTLAAPHVSPPGGVFATAPAVVLTADAGAVVHYTTNGSAPNQGSPQYTGPITISSSSVLRARAYKSGWTASATRNESYVIDVVGPTIVPTITPGANAAGWNNTPVTVSFTCVDASAVTSCPAPVSFAQDGAGQSITVSSQDALGFQTSLTVTINIDSVAPVVTLSSPAADLSTSDATLALAGTVTDAGSGIVRTLCGGEPAAMSGANASCTVPLLPGLNAAVLVAVDQAGNSTSAGRQATRLATPTEIVIAPTTVALAVGDLRGLTVTTDAGLTPTGVTWTSSNPSVVSIAPENDGTIVAESLGQTTITATLGSLTAEATVRVLPGAVAPGESIWTVAPTPGRQLQAPMRANPVRDDDPDMFSIEVDPATSATLVKAVRGADGATLWSHHVPQPPFAADPFAGYFYVTHDAHSRTTLHRRGAGGVPPWDYASSGGISGVASAPDGTVYLMEDVTTPSGLIPTNSYPTSVRSDSYIVGLEGQTGAVRFRLGVPYQSSAFLTSETPDHRCIEQKYDGGGISGPMTVVENGDVVVQHLTERFNGAEGVCGPQSETWVQNTLRLLRISPSGGMSATVMNQYSGSWPGAFPGAGQEQAWPGVNRPDGHGGVLATWTLNTNDGMGNTVEGVVSRVVSGSVAYRQAANWAIYDYQNRDDVMVTSNGTIYAPGGPSGELSARATDTWAPLWTSSAWGIPINGLGDGGLLVSTDDGTGQVIQELDGSAAVVGSYSASIYWPFDALPDQDLLFGIDANGQLVQMSAPSKRRSLWTFLKNVFGGCTAAPLKADDPSAVDIGLVATTAPYTFDFKDTGPYSWSVDQILGVRDAFKAWEDEMVANGLPYRFRAFSQAEHDAAADPGQPLAPQADLQLKRLPLPLGPNGALVGGDYAATGPLQGRRATKGLIRFNTDPQVLFKHVGYLKVGLHEIGHALGLGHRSSERVGGSVMNRLRSKKKSDGTEDFSDDAGGNMPTKPTECDIRRVTDAIGK